MPIGVLINSSKFFNISSVFTIIFTFFSWHLLYNIIMKIIISPAKKMKMIDDINIECTTPLFLSKTTELLNHIQIWIWFKSSVVLDKNRGVVHSMLISSIIFIFLAGEIIIFIIILYNRCQEKKVKIMVKTEEMLKNLEELINTPIGKSE